MNPENALSASAQIAVAVAGFAGVAASFGSEPIRAWSRVDRMRLRFLLFGAALPLVLFIVELRKACWNTAIYWGMWSPVSLLVILQAYNATVLQEFWPFYALIVVQLCSAIVQFIRLILYRGVTSD